MIKYCSISFIELLESKEVIFSWRENKDLLLTLEAELETHPNVIFTDIGHHTGWCNFNSVCRDDEIKIYNVKYLDKREKMLKGFIALLDKTRDPTHFLMEVEKFFSIEICTFNFTGKAVMLTKDYAENVKKYLKI